VKKYFHEITKAEFDNLDGLTFQQIAEDYPQPVRTRLELVRSWGVMPNPMRYQPLDTLEKNSYVDPNWTERELLGTMRYYSKLNWLGGFPFEEYNKTPQLELL